MSTQATIYGVISTLEKYPIEEAKRILFQQAQDMDRAYDTQVQALRRKAEVFDQLDAYGCSSAKIWLDTVDKLGHLSSQAPGNLSEEVRKIDEMLHFTAHKLTPSEAVKWLHDLYTEQCVTLQECAQRHKIGLGGEKLAKVVADAVDELTAARDHHLSGWVAVTTAIPADNGQTVEVMDESGRIGRGRPMWTPFVPHKGALIPSSPVFDGWVIEIGPGLDMSFGKTVKWRPLPIPPYTPQQEKR